MTWAKLFAPSIVLLVWAVIWSRGVRGDTVIVAGLALVAASTVLAEWERHKLRRRG